MLSLLVCPSPEYQVYHLLSEVSHNPREKRKTNCVYKTVRGYISVFHLFKDMITLSDLYFPVYM